MVRHLAKLHGGGKIKTKQVWSPLALKMKASKNKWMLAKGPMGGTIATLFDVGWVPAKPDCWLSPGGGVWQMGPKPNEESSGVFLEYLENQFKRLLQYIPIGRTLNMDYLVFSPSRRFVLTREAELSK